MIIRPLVTAIAAACCLSACAPATLTTSGTTLRAIVASQIIAPQPHRATGSDGQTAVAAYANYQQSYVTPAAQAANSTFGSTK